uniref:Integrase catalytic domain-containing protein n=1 Tax=Anopheles dirus TaxID=7168 RepID=A0A182ND74_9DIPT
WYHHRFRHANRETVVNEIRQRFDTNNLRALVNRVSRNCMLCTVMKAAPRLPPMAPLAAYERPFTYTGLDYFGPVLVKVGRANAKRWVALEIVHSLSTESCIMAVKRFIARRGTPLEFWTDNATCFQGASKELKTEIEARNETLAATFTSTNTSWKFIPVATPHLGGSKKYCQGKTGALEKRGYAHPVGYSDDLQQGSQYWTSSEEVNLIRLHGEGYVTTDPTWTRGE